LNNLLASKICGEKRDVSFSSSQDEEFGDVITGSTSDVETPILWVTIFLQKGIRSMKAFTDYPIIELGDASSVPAPIRECEVTGYDGNKYAEVAVGGVATSFKAGYLYTQAGRCGQVPRVSIADLEALMAPQTTLNRE
jgi:hypothetical protein